MNAQLLAHVTERELEDSRRAIGSHRLVDVRMEKCSETTLAGIGRCVWEQSQKHTLHHDMHEQVGEFKKGMKIHHRLGVSDTYENRVSAILLDLLQQVQ